LGDFIKNGGKWGQPYCVKIKGQAKEQQMSPYQKIYQFAQDVLSDPRELESLRVFLTELEIGAGTVGEAGRQYSEAELDDLTKADLSVEEALAMLGDDHVES
jgi:hypothetical protein